MANLQAMVRRQGGVRFIDEGPRTSAPPVVLLHGMLGDLSNWEHTIEVLSEAGYRVLVPVLPVYDLPLLETSVSGLVDYVRRFLETLGVGPVVLVGNSLGGHVALIYAHRFPEQVPAMVLSGASGIYEVNMGTSTPKRRDRGFIRDRAAYTFYDPAHVTEALVDDMYGIVNNRAQVTRLIKMARATKNESVLQNLEALRMPVLLVWGKEDKITPPDVAREFEQRISGARLHFVDLCGHAPMIERPEVFNPLLLEFLSETVDLRTEPSPM